MNSVDKGLRFKPSFLGERHDPTLRASIEGIGLDNFDAGALASALAEGILLNMREMMPAWAFEGRSRAVASGNALRKLSIMRHHARRVFGLPLTLPESREEAACGAAIVASRL
jgi:sugar (pentulose or hexulose) kinase